MSIKMQLNKSLLVLALATAVAMPIFVAAAPDPGIKPTSFFYFLDTAAESIDLFFTFNAEKKAEKALTYAEERLAEIEAVSRENAPKAIEKAANRYQTLLAVASSEAQGLQDGEKAKKLFSAISESMVKHQEILAVVYNNASDESKATIEKALEVSVKGHEQALQQNADLQDIKVVEPKKEVAELKQQKQEVKNLKTDLQDVKTTEKERAIIKQEKQPAATTQPSPSESQEQLLIPAQQPVASPVPSAENQLVKVEKCKAEKELHYNKMIEVLKEIVDMQARKFQDKLINIMIQQGFAPGAVTPDTFSGIIQSRVQKSRAENLEMAHEKTEAFVNEKYIECLDR